MPWSNGKGRGTKYGAPHQRARAEAIKSITPATPCSRCGHALGPEHTYRNGRKIGLWHYDHDEHGGYLGFSHGGTCPACRRKCNVSAGSRKGARIRNGVRPRRQQKPAKRDLL